MYNVPLMARVGFVSLGCPKNLVDSEVMLGMLSQSGHQITPRAQDAEIIVVNTCGFIQSAQQESINTILEMAAYKESGPCQRLIVAGCLVERFRDQIQQQIPEVDAVIGTNEIPRILEVCSQSLAAKPPQYEGRELYLYDDQAPRILTTPRYSAYIKIAEGCDHPCSFCVIPQMRGGFRSRPVESVLREAQRLAQSGVKELNLVGQDTTMYGWDRGDRQGLAHLLRRLGEVDGIEWVRFLYAYPNNIYDELLDALREVPQACKYIDVPLQHASKKMLSLMKRGGNRGSLLRLVERIRERVPDVAIRTTFIVGFPGETEEDFEELSEFVRQARFERLGVFIYSDEEEATSHALSAKVPAQVAQQRQARLMKVQRKIARQTNRNLVGKILPVLLEGPSKESDLLWEGRLSTQAPDIDGVVYLTDGIDEGVQAGEIRPVRIERAHDHDLIGQVVVPGGPVAQAPIREEAFQLADS